MDINVPTYTPHVWQNKGEEDAIPINATNLNEIEDGITNNNIASQEIVDYLGGDFEAENNALFNDVYEGKNIAEIPEIQDELDTYGSVPAFLQARAQNLDSSYLHVGDWCYVDNSAMSNWKYAIYAFWPYLGAYQDNLYPGHIVMGPLDTVFNTLTSWNSGSNNNNGTSSVNQPYAASLLHSFELSTILPTFSTAWQNVMMDTYLYLESRYSSSGSLSASTSWSWVDCGKIWSLSPIEVLGHPNDTTVPFATGVDCHFPFFYSTRHRLMKNGSGFASWWMRTASGLNSTAASGVSGGGYAAGYLTANEFGVVPCFNVA